MRPGRDTLQGIRSNHVLINRRLRRLSPAYCTATMAPISRERNRITVRFSKFVATSNNAASPINRRQEETDLVAGD